jgi:hypothetical protein
MTALAGLTAPLAVNGSPCARTAGPDVLRDFISVLHARVEGLKLGFGRSGFDILLANAAHFSGFMRPGRFAVDARGVRDAAIAAGSDLTHLVLPFVVGPSRVRFAFCFLPGGLIGAPVPPRPLIRGTLCFAIVTSSIPGVSAATTMPDHDLSLSGCNRQTHRC